MKTIVYWTVIADRVDGGGSSYAEGDLLPGVATAVVRMFDATSALLEAERTHGSPLVVRMVYLSRDSAREVAKEARASGIITARVMRCTRRVRA